MCFSVCVWGGGGGGGQSFSELFLTVPSRGDPLTVVHRIFFFYS